MPRPPTEKGLIFIGKNSYQVDFSRGPITKEQAEQWKQGLQGLIAQGSAAVPAIREFLEQNQELNFGAIAGGERDARVLHPEH